MRRRSRVDSDTSTGRTRPTRRRTRNTTGNGAGGTSSWERTSAGSRRATGSWERTDRGTSDRGRRRTRSSREEVRTRRTPHARGQGETRQGRRPLGRLTAAGGGPSLITVGIIVVALVFVIGGVVGVSHLLGSGSQQAQEQQSEKSPEEKAEEAAAKRAKQLVADMTLEQKVAQLFIVRPEAITGVSAATEAGQTTREAISEYPVGGLIYSAQNFVDKSQTITLIKSTQNYVKDASGLPAFMCVEEEGGQWGPVASAYLINNEVPSAALIGAGNDEAKARDAATQVSTYLADLGLNLNIAPVADIVTSVDSDLSERSFGDEPANVAKMVSAQVDGYAHSGMLCAVKHFPGIGEAERDPHNGRLYSHRTREELLKREVVPFAAAIDAGVPIVVVSSMSCLEMGNGEGDLPAWMSETVVDGLLRDELGFKGVAMTDMLDDESLADACDPADQGVRAIKAGMDVIVCPQDFEKAYKGLIKAVKNGDISEKRIDKSVQRVVRLKDSLAS